MDNLIQFLATFLGKSADEIKSIIESSDSSQLSSSFKSKVESIRNDADSQALGRIGKKAQKLHKELTGTDTESTDLEAVVKSIYSVAQTKTKSDGITDDLIKETDFFKSYVQRVEGEKSKLSETLNSFQEKIQQKEKREYAIGLIADINFKESNPTRKQRLIDSFVNEFNSLKVEQTSSGGKVFFENDKRLENPQTYVPLSEKEVAKAIALRWLDEAESEPGNGGQYDPGQKEKDKKVFEFKSNSDFLKYVNDTSIPLADRKSAMENHKIKE